MTASVELHTLTRIEAAIHNKLQQEFIKKPAHYVVISPESFNDKIEEVVAEVMGSYELDVTPHVTFNRVQDSIMILIEWNVN